MQPMNAPTQLVGPAHLRGHGRAIRPQCAGLDFDNAAELQATLPPCIALPGRGAAYKYRM
jgi:hypothetical protein